MEIIKMLELEKDIPLPSRGESNKLSELIKNMEIGDSSTCPLYLRNSMHARFKFYGRKCKTQKLLDSNELYIRVWRVL